MSAFFFSFSSLFLLIFILSPFVPWSSFSSSASSRPQFSYSLGTSPLYPLTFCVLSSVAGVSGLGGVGAGWTVFGAEMPLFLQADFGLGIGEALVPEWQVLCCPLPQLLGAPLVDGVWASSGEQCLGAA